MAFILILLLSDEIGAILFKQGRALFPLGEKVEIACIGELKLLLELSNVLTFRRGPWNCVLALASTSGYSSSPLG
jgi:hypothetical protein